MAFITNEQKAFSGGGQKNLTLTFSDGTIVTNDQISTESFSLEQSLSESGSSLMYGSFCSSKMEVEVSTEIGSHKGQEVVVTITADGFTKQLGKFVVETDYRTDNKLNRTIIAYDKLYGLNEIDVVAWYNNLKFPMTLGKFRNTFFNHIGITQVQTTLINDSIVLYKNAYAYQLSAFDVLNCICEINACFGKINEDGVFEYVSLVKPTTYTATHEYSTADYKLGGLSYEDWQVQPITKVIVRNNILNDDSTEDAVSYIEGSYGTDGNVYVIEDNIISVGKTEQQLNAIAEIIYNQVKDITYSVATLSAKHNTDVKLGDFVKVVGNADTIEFPVLSRTISGITALSDEFSADGTEFYEYDTNQIQRNLSLYQKLLLENAQKVNVVNADLGRFKVLVADEFSAVNVDITNLKADMITTENLDAKLIEVGSLRADDITSESGQFHYLSTDQLNAKYLDAELVNLDVANIDKANVGSLFAEVGLITDATIKDGHITGYLDSVEVNTANITAGTLVADRLLLKDATSGNYIGFTTDGTSVQKADFDADDIIKDHTITADHIVANTITSNEIASATITANEIASNTITANEIASKTITADKISVEDLSVLGALTIKDNSDEIIFKADASTKDVKIGGFTANAEEFYFGEESHQEVGDKVSIRPYIGARGYAVDVSSGYTNVSGDFEVNVRGGTNSISINSNEMKFSTIPQIPYTKALDGSTNIASAFYRPIKGEVLLMPYTASGSSYTDTKNDWNAFSSFQLVMRFRSSSTSTNWYFQSQNVTKGLLDGSFGATSQGGRWNFNYYGSTTSKLAGNMIIDFANQSVQLTSSGVTGWENPSFALIGIY